MASPSEIDWSSVQTAIQRIMGVSQAWDTVLGGLDPEDELEAEPRRPSLPSLGDLNSLGRE